MMRYAMDPRGAAQEGLVLWRNLEEAAPALKPGDCVVLAPGCGHAPAVLSGLQGQPEAPITIMAEEPGTAWIDGGAGNGLVLRDCAYIRVVGLVSRGAGRKYHNQGGIGFLLEDCENILIQDCTAEGYQHAGVSVRGGAYNRLVGVTARDNGGCGIISEPSSRGYGRFLTVSHCRALNNPGDPTVRTNHSGNGILIMAVEDARVEYCEAAYNGWDMNNDNFNGPVGIWTACHAHRVVIDHCISHDNRTQWGKTDGGGFDFDGGTCDCVIQYCYSYNNDGCGYLVCQYTGGDAMVHNTVRFSVSYNDGRAYHRCSVCCADGGGPNPAHTAYLYHNFFYNSQGRDIVSGHYDHTVFLQNRMELEGGGNFLQELAPERPGKATILKGKPCQPMTFYGNSYMDWDERSSYTAYYSLEAWSQGTGQERVGERCIGMALPMGARTDCPPLEDPKALDALLPRMLGALWMEPKAIGAVLETERLLLRPFTVSDLGAFVSLLEIPEVPGWQMQRDRAGDFLRWQIQNYDAMDIIHGTVCLGIFDKETGVLLGAVGAGEHDDLHETEIFYSLLPQARGKGYAREAASAATQWALDTYAIPYVIGTADADNLPSQRVLEACGFEFWQERDLTVHILGERQRFRCYRRFRTKTPQGVPSSNED